MRIISLAAVCLALSGCASTLTALGLTSPTTVPAIAADGTVLCQKFATGVAITTKIDPSLVQHNAKDIALVTAACAKIDAAPASTAGS
jgi:hypothetical protein